MTCILSCGLAGVFLFSMVFMLFAVDKGFINKTLMDKLSPELQQKYLERVDERRNIYIMGFAGGLIISLISLYFLRKSVMMGGISSACYVIALTYIIVLIYYSLSPKKDLLVVEIPDQETRQAWNQIYKYMKTTYLTSMLLGVIFVGLLSYGLCSDKKQ